MNFQWYNVLAAADDGLINILVLVVLAVIGLIGHLIKKAQEKQQLEEADRKVEQAKRRHAAAKYSSEAAQQTRPPAAPAAEARQKAALVHAAATLGHGVGQEVLQVRKQLAAKEMQQRKRLAPTKHLQPTIGDTAMHTEHAVGDGPKIHLNLTGYKAARAAIICAEILGPPKALRANPEPWEM